MQAKYSILRNQKNENIGDVMTLKQLEAFYWAATCDSFAVAAVRLNVSVSSLSKRISELEQVLSGALFDRTNRRAVLTALGEDMLPHAQALLRDVDQFRMRANSNLSLTGRCRFGVGELTALTWLPSMMSAIQDSHPDLWVEPMVDIGASLEQGLESGELDFAIISGPSTRTAIASHVIGHAQFQWVTSACANDELRPTALADNTLITQSRGAGTVRMLDEWLTARGATVGRQMGCQNIGGIANLIAGGMGIGFLPAAWAEKLIQKGLLLPLKHFPALQPLPYAFHWRRDDTRPMVRKLRDIAAAQIHFSAPPALS